MSDYYIKNILYCFCFALFSLFITQAMAADAASPKAFDNAITIYKQQGTRAFINAMVKGGPLEGRQDLKSQILVLEKIEDYYGDFVSVDIIHINTLSDSTRMVYFILNFEKGPVFGSLTAYDSGRAEIITAFDFHTKADKIFPQSLLTTE